MLVEHDDVGDLLAQLRDQTEGYRVPDYGCASTPSGVAEPAA